MNSVHKAETLVYDPERVRPDGSPVGTVSPSSGAGFRVSHSVAFLLTFLAMAITVGVGIIVFFSVQRAPITCNCRCADSGSGKEQPEGFHMSIAKSEKYFRKHSEARWLLLAR